MHCTSCGQPGVGRFCTNCGQAVDLSAPRPAVATYDAALDPDPSDTAERRAVRRRAALEPMPPRTPPDAADTPRAPRYPLYADEVTDPTATAATQHLPVAEHGGLLDRLTTTPTAPGPRAGADEPEDGPRRRPLRMTLLVLLLILLIGVVLVAAVFGWRA